MLKRNKSSNQYNWEAVPPRPSPFVASFPNCSHENIRVEIAFQTEIQILVFYWLIANIFGSVALSGIFFWIQSKPFKRQNHYSRTSVVTLAILNPALEYKI